MRWPIVLRTVLALLAGCTHRRAPDTDAGAPAAPADAHAGCPTAERFAALHEGMTRAEVETLMGGPGVVQSETPEVAFVNYVCVAPKRRITVTYRGGVLAIKTQDGL